MSSAPANKPGTVTRFLRQSGALLKKNALIRARSWRLNLFHALQSIAIIFLVWAIDKAVSYSNSQFTGAKALRTPAAKDIPAIPSCRDDLFLLHDQPCFTFIYTPNNSPAVEELVAAIRQSNDPPIPANEVLGMKNADEVDQYLWDHPQTVLAAVHLTVANGKAVSYILQTNSSSVFFKGGFQDPNMYIQLPLQVALEKAVAYQDMRAAGAVQGLDSFSWSIRIKDFPHPSLTVDSIAGRVAPVFVLASLMFNFVILLTSLVTEKENGTRAAMSTMGMIDGAYWLSWVLPELVMGALHATLLTATARAFQFEMVIVNNFVLLLLLVFLTNTALMAFGFAVSTFVQKGSLAVPLSFAIFIVAWVLQLVVYFGFPFNSSSASGRGLAYLFSIFPWTLLSKGMLDLADATTGSWQQGISWDTRFSYCWAMTPPPDVSSQQQQYWQSACHLSLGQTYWVLLVQAVGYMVLALYLDNVLPGGEQAPAARPWYFLLTRTFWMPKKTQDVRYMREALAGAAAAQQELQPEDEDVKAEAAAVQRLCADCCNDTSSPQQPSPAQLSVSSGLHLFGLRKVYGGTSWNWPWRAPFGSAPARQDDQQPAGNRAPHTAAPPQGKGSGHVAVAGTWLSIPEGQCFCLLGPNGAGKTTSIKCLVGGLRPTGGDALVYGQSIRSPGGRTAAQAITGVCPQFDVLWSELTALEHMMLYSDIKGLPWSLRRAKATELLDKVGLLPAANAAAGSFSGGMKRRLSVAVALLGDPKVLYLDEPTTGMDPVSRRQVWDLLDAAKRERVVVLTTHSMEEADVLGDRIGIIAAGRMQCLGTSLRLKTKFGSGYRVSLLLQQQETDELHAKPEVQTPSVDAGAHAVSNMIHPALAAALVQHLGADVLTSRASVDLTATDNLPAPGSSAANGHSAAMYLNLIVPQNQDRQLLSFLDFLHDASGSLGVQDVQIGLTPLEEVYLKVVQNLAAATPPPT